MAIPSDESGSTSYSSMLERLKKRPALQQEFKGQLAEKAGVDAADVNDKNLAGVSSALRGAGEVAKSGSDPSKADVSSLQAADPAKAAAPAKTDDPEEKSKQQKLMMALAGVLPTMLGYAFGGYEGGAIGAKAGAAGVEEIGRAHV